MLSSRSPEMQTIVPKGAAGPPAIGNRFGPATIQRRFCASSMVPHASISKLTTVTAASRAASLKLNVSRGDHREVSKCFFSESLLQTRAFEHVPLPQPSWDRDGDGQPH